VIASVDTLCFNFFPLLFLNDQDGYSGNEFGCVLFSLVGLCYIVCE
jgi:hypothetical protein